MRTQYFISLIVALMVAGTFWYHSTANVCPVPLAYRLGELDSSFALSPEAARAHIEAAAAVWETGVERDLFVYDETADFTINFQFDERQEFADSESAQRRSLDAQKAENDRLIADLERLEGEYETLAASYSTRLDQYEADLTAYNQRVSRYNDQGGAPQEVFAALEAERIELNQRSAELGRTADQLNQLVNRINQLGADTNRRVDAYNRQVDAYNEEFGYSREFTQGDYQGDRINIYKFSTENELVTVLAHEFGHALGIDHVDDPDSLMYYLMDDTDQVPALGTADRRAYLEVCGAEQSFAQRVRHWIRSL